MENDLHVTGTLIWYYYICHREVWLMARNITPDEDNPNIDLGRFIGKDTYQRDKKEIEVGHIKLDIIRNEKGKVVVGEVKKSSKFENSASMQLAFYLDELRQRGVNATGELLFPKERRKVIVELNQALIDEIESAKRNILKIIYQNVPPAPKKITYCKNCAYAEFCWS